MNKLSIAIMHCPFYEERKTIVQKIINQLGKANILNELEDFAVIEDWKKRGVWHTAKKSWEFCLSTDATHHLVIQDDISLCNDFIHTVKELIKVFPKKIMCLYANRKICEQAKEKDIRWIGIADGIWGQACLLPKEETENFLEWDNNHIKKEFKWDDSRLTMYCLKKNHIPLCPMPSLVEHICPSNSTLGNNNKTRVARWFVSNKSYLEYDWSKTDMITQRTSSFRHGWPYYYD